MFAIAYDWLGLDGIVLWTALIIMLTWGIVYGQAMHKSKSLLSALLFVALGVGASQIHVLPRPHIFTYLLTAIWIKLLDNIAEGRFRSWWLLPLVMFFWVNLHGMFVLGIGILGIYLISDFMDRPSISWFRTKQAKELLLAGGLSVLATFFSPSGLKIWGAIASLGSNAYITSRIPEYQSPNFHLPETWPFLILILLAIIGFARRNEKSSWKDLLLVSSFTALALYTSRMIPLFAIVVTPITAKLVTDLVRSDYPESRFFIFEENINKINSTSNGLVWLVLIVLLAAVLLRSGTALDAQGKGNAFDKQFFPAGAVSWLETHPQSGHMFNEFDWGGYLLLKLWPRYQIFMDGHTHIYGEALTREYEQVISLGNGWQQILNKYDVKWILIRVNTPLANALGASADWTPTYEDQTAVIFMRK
jgi:hypothetical protein